MRLTAATPLLAVAAATLVATLAGRALWAQMFSSNPQYKITALEIQPGATKSAAQIRALSGIREGDNIHSFGADDVRRRILSSALEIEEAEVAKTLPGTVRIAIRDRIPVALLLDERRALDAGGLVFPLVGGDIARYRTLPRIENGASRMVADAGRRLSGTPGATPETPESKMERALRVVLALDARPDFPVRVDTFDVSDPAYLVFLTADNRVVRILWEEIPGDAEIGDALDLLEGTLRDRRSARVGRFDVMRSTRKVHARP